MIPLTKKTRCVESVFVTGNIQTDKVVGAAGSTVKANANVNVIKSLFARRRKRHSL